MKTKPALANTGTLRAVVTTTNRPITPSKYLTTRSQTRSEILIKNKVILSTPMMENRLWYMKFVQEQIRTTALSL